MAGGGSKILERAGGGKDGEPEGRAAEQKCSGDCGAPNSHFCFAHFGGNVLPSSPIFHNLIMSKINL